MLMSVSCIRCIGVMPLLFEWLMHKRVTIKYRNLFSKKDVQNCKVNGINIKGNANFDNNLSNTYLT